MLRPASRAVRVVIRSTRYPAGPAAVTHSEPGESASRPAPLPGKASGFDCAGTAIEAVVRPVCGPIRITVPLPDAHTAPLPATMSRGGGVTGYRAVTRPVAGSARTSEKYGGRPGMAPRAEHTPGKPRPRSRASTRPVTGLILSSPASPSPAHTLPAP